MKYFHRYPIHLEEVILKNQQSGTYFKGNIGRETKDFVSHCPCRYSYDFQIAG